MMQASSTDSAATASSEHATTQAMVGSALVVASQVFTALQMVAEEKFVTGYNAPALMAVGWEGVWGLVGITALLCGLQNTPGQPVEDSLWAFEQIRQQPRLIMLMLANALSIAFFNYFGMSITKSSSASYRTVLDSLRTLAVWLIDVCIGGKPVHPLQLSTCWKRSNPICPSIAHLSRSFSLSLFLSLSLSLSRCNDIEEETVCGKKITTHVLFLPREALI